jgi:hypothetical protein
VGTEVEEDGSEGLGVLFKAPAGLQIKKDIPVIIKPDNEFVYWNKMKSHRDAVNKTLLKGSVPVSVKETKGGKRSAAVAPWSEFGFQPASTSVAALFPKAYFEAQRAYIAAAMRNKPKANSTQRAKVLWVVDVLTRVNFCYLALNIPFYETSVPGLELLVTRTWDGMAPGGVQAGPTGRIGRWWNTDGGRGRSTPYEGYHSLAAALLESINKFYDTAGRSGKKNGPAPFIDQPILWMFPRHNKGADYTIRRKILSDVIPWMEKGYTLKAKGNKDAGDLKKAKGNAPLTEGIKQWRLWMLQDFIDAPKHRGSDWLPESMGSKVNNMPTLLTYIDRVKKEDPKSRRHTRSISIPGGGGKDSVSVPNFAWVFNNGGVERFSSLILGMNYSAEVRSQVNTWYLASIPKLTRDGKYDAQSFGKNCQVTVCKVFQPITATDFTAIKKREDDDEGTAIKGFVKDNSNAASLLEAELNLDPEKISSSIRKAEVRNAINAVEGMADKVQNVMDDVETTLEDIGKAVVIAEAALATAGVSVAIGATITTAVTAVVGATAAAAVAGAVAAISAALGPLGAVVAVAFAVSLVVQEFLPPTPVSFPFYSIRHPFMRTLRAKNWTTTPDGASFTVIHRVLNGILNMEQVSKIDMGIYDGIRNIRPPQADKFGNAIPGLKQPSTANNWDPSNNMSVKQAQQLMKECTVKDIKVTGKYEGSFNANLLKSAKNLGIAEDDVRIGLNKDLSRITILPPDFVQAMTVCVRKKKGVLFLSGLTSGIQLKGNLTIGIKGIPTAPQSAKEFGFGKKISIKNLQQAIKDCRKVKAVEVDGKWSSNDKKKLKATAKALGFKEKDVKWDDGKKNIRIAPATLLPAILECAENRLKKIERDKKKKAKKKKPKGPPKQAAFPKTKDDGLSTGAKVAVGGAVVGALALAVTRLRR